MKYALLVHQPQEYFDRRNDKAAMAAGKAYGEALQAAGLFVGGAGLESPQAATTVSIRDGKRQVHDGPYAETKEFLAGFGIIDVPDGPLRSLKRAIRPLDLRRSRRSPQTGLPIISPIGPLAGTCWRCSIAKMKRRKLSPVLRA